jgi:hypothetical protein
MEFLKMAIERAKQLGRNVAQAMNAPIEQAKYLGEQAGVDCPLCHSNVLLIPEDLPYVGCPVCWIRGTIVVDKGKMKVEWNMKDVELPRFSYEGLNHHQRQEQYKDTQWPMRVSKEDRAALVEPVFAESKVKIITPGA